MLFGMKMQILKVFGVGGQWQLAREIGVSESTLSRIVAGRRSPTEEERAALANALRTSEQVLFDTDGDAPIEEAGRLT